MLRALWPVDIYICWRLKACRRIVIEIRNLCITGGRVSQNTRSQRPEPQTNNYCPMSYNEPKVQRTPSLKVVFPGDLKLVK